MTSLTTQYELSRQAIHQHHGRVTRRFFEDEIVIQLVLEWRLRMPRLGGKKLYHLLKGDFKKLGFKLGRDGFFGVLRTHSLLIKPLKRSTRTTNSFHRYRVYKNLLSALEIIRKNQAWVSDITYLRLANSFLYLFLITDLFSRKIVGWCLHHSLAVEGALNALRGALDQAGKRQETIHHSDRGVQYCSDNYVATLKDSAIRISMGEVGNPYENAHAERVNGILKGEFFLDQIFESRAAADKATRQAIQTYNELRPHWSLHMKTPAYIYGQ